jgi:hypothetical protein
MKHELDSLPPLTPRQAYLAMLEYLSTEFELAGDDKTVHLGGLLAEMEPEEDGSTSDPGAGLTFADAIRKVFEPGYRSRLKGRWADA